MADLFFAFDSLHAPNLFSSKTNFIIAINIYLLPILLASPQLFLRKSDQQLFSLCSLYFAALLQLFFISLFTAH